MPCPNLNLVDKILDYMEDRPFKIITYKELYETIWEVPVYAGYKNTLRNTINRARYLLEDNCKIHNIQKIGYIYVEKEIMND